MIGGDSVSDFVNTTSGVAQGVTAKFGVGGAGVVAGAVSPPPNVYNQNSSTWIAIN